MKIEDMYVIEICKFILILFISAHQLNPDWVRLTTSRGFESTEHKLFMRYTGNLSYI